MTANQFENIRRDFLEKRGNAAVEALSNRGIDAEYTPTATRAVEKVLEIIPAGSMVGAGGSVTLRETGILEKLAEKGCHVVHHQPGMELAESLRVRKEAINCSYYLCSSNAITMEGELVNTDGIGNRVCGMVFGPETVIVIAGVNKLVMNRDEAISRIRNIAAPANAIRLGIETPCVDKGYCVDCRSPMNICRVTTIVSGKPIWTNMRVYLVGEPLGL